MIYFTNLLDVTPVTRYDTIEEFNVDSKAEYSASSSIANVIIKAYRHITLTAEYRSNTVFWTYPQHPQSLGGGLKA